MTDSPAAPAPRKVTLYRNGSVYTAADPFATAMLIDGDTVAWVGSEQAATSIADSSMEVIDLQGALLAPGFVDSHVHLTETGIALDGLQLAGVRSATELLDAVAGAPLQRGWYRPGPRLGREHLGRSHAAHPGRNRTRGRRPHRSICPASMSTRPWYPAPWPRRPVWTGSTATPAARSNAGRTPRPAWRPASCRPTPCTRYQRRALAEAAANGYVALAEMAAPHIGSIEDLQLATAWNGTANGVNGAAVPEILPYWGELATSQEHAQSILDGLGVSVLGLAGDLNIDGSIGSRTAALRADYADAPGERGNQYLSVAEAAAHLAACSLLGIQAGFHVIGDAGLDAALDALDLAAAEVGEQRVRAAGHRFEHVELADPAAISRLARYSVTVSAQPVFDALWGGGDSLYQQRLGSRRLGMNAFGSFYAAGVPICFGSDSPVTPLRPWSSVRACLQHTNPAEQISARAAFLGHTRAGWRAARYPNPMAGQLVPGAPASFAVWEVEELMVQVADGRVQSWSTDPRARTPLLPALDTGSDPACLLTVRDGQELYASGALGA